MLKVTNEAGMCMKTKERQTICPKIKRHVIPTFTHFTQTNLYFAEFCRNQQLFCPFSSPRNEFFASQLTADKQSVVDS